MTSDISNEKKKKKEKKHINVTFASSDDKGVSSSKLNKNSLVTLEILDRPNLYTGPILTQFKGRLPPTLSLAGFKDINDRTLKVEKPEFMLRGHTQTMAYQATTPITKDNIPLKPAYKYLVGIYNKKRQKVTLVESPLLETQTCPSCLLHSNVSDSSTQLSLKDSKNDLAQTFGTRKRKTAVASLERNAVNYDSLRANSDILHKVSESRAAATEAEPINSTVDLLPPHDTSTGAVDLIYPLNQVVDSSVIKSITVFSLIKNWPDFNPQAELAHGNSEWILEKIKENASSIGPQAKYNIQLLVLLDAIIAISLLRKGVEYATPGDLLRELFGRSLKVKVASGVAAYLCTTFLFPTFSNSSSHSTLREVFQLTGNSALKAQIFAVIIMLHLTDFKLRVDIVSQSFRVDLSKARTILKGVGCTLSTSSIDKPDGKKESVTYGVLKAPLTITTQSKLRRN